MEKTRMMKTKTERGREAKGRAIRPGAVALPPAGMLSQLPPEPSLSW